MLSHGIISFYCISSVFDGFSYSIHLPNIIDFIAKIITPIPKIDPKNTYTIHKIFAKICTNTIKRTTTNLICIVCHTLCFLDWDIQQANVFFHSIVNGIRIQHTYCHFNVFMLLSFFCCFFFCVYIIRFLRDRINKRGNFCTVRWFLIQHFVCHCFFFVVVLPKQMMCHEAISVFLDQIYFMFLRKKDPYIYGRFWFFFLTKFHWNFFITFRLKFIFVGLNEIHHSFRSIIFFCMKLPKKCCHEIVFVHNYLWSLFHSCFSYFPFFIVFFFSHITRSQNVCTFKKIHLQKVGTFNMKYIFLYKLWAM